MGQTRRFPRSPYSAYLRPIARADERTRTADLLITSVRCTSGLYSGLPILSGLSSSDSSQCLLDAERTTGFRRERWGVEPRPLRAACQESLAPAQASWTGTGTGPVLRILPTS